MRFRDIPRFIQDGGYCVDLSLDDLIGHVDRYISEYNLQLQPDFQRAHVWTDAQAAKYVEFLLRGGNSSRVVYFNYPGWMRDFTGDFVLVDGLQRLTACLRFMRNELPILDGQYYDNFTDRLSQMVGLKFNINCLQTKAEVLQWYLDLNDGGVVHTTDELDKVREMLEQEK